MQDATELALQIWLTGAAIIMAGCAIFLRLEGGRWTPLEFAVALLIGFTWPIAASAVVIGRTLMFIGAPRGC